MRSFVLRRALIHRDASRALRVSIRSANGRLGAVLLSAFLCFLSGCSLLRGPRAERSRLSAGVHHKVLVIEGQERSYLLYVPKQQKPRAPLVILLHGSKQTGASFRRATGYAFDRLADRYGFVAAYPNGYRKHWNDCRESARYAARKRGVDDVGFLMSLIERLEKSSVVDPQRVFLAGYSNGAHMAFRVATERPDRIAAIAAFSANLPTAENWACTGAIKPVSVLFINGTEDPINPHEGGTVSVFGFASRGRVLSSFESASYLARLSGLTHRQQRTLTQGKEQVDEYRWSEEGKPEVMLLAVRGGGHVVPGPSTAFPDILGHTSRSVDGPEVAWRFFARQKLRRAPSP